MYYCVPIKLLFNILKYLVSSCGQVHVLLRAWILLVQSFYGIMANSIFTYESDHMIYGCE